MFLGEGGEEKSRKIWVPSFSVGGVAANFVACFTNEIPSCPVFLHTLQWHQCTPAFKPPTEKSKSNMIKKYANLLFVTSRIDLPRSSLTIGENSNRSAWLRIRVPEFSMIKRNMLCFPHFKGHLTG